MEYIFSRSDVLTLRQYYLAFIRSFIRYDFLCILNLFVIDKMQSKSHLSILLYFLENSILLLTYRIKQS